MHTVVVACIQIGRVKSSLSLKIEQTQYTSLNPPDSNYLGLLDYESMATEAHKSLLDYEKVVTDGFRHLCLKIIDIEAKFYIAGKTMEFQIWRYHIEMLSTPKLYTDYVTTLDPIVSKNLQMLSKACTSLAYFTSWLDNQMSPDRLLALQEHFEADNVHFPAANNRFKFFMQAALRKITISSKVFWVTIIMCLLSGTFGVYITYKFHTAPRAKTTRIWTNALYAILTLVMIALFSSHIFSMGLISSVVQGSDKALTKLPSSIIQIRKYSGVGDMIEQLQQVESFIDRLRTIDISTSKENLKGLIDLYTYGSRLEYDRPRKRLDSLNKRLECQSLEVHFTSKTCPKIGGVSCFVLKDRTIDDFYDIIDTCVSLKSYVSFPYDQVRLYLSQEKKAMDAVDRLLEPCISGYVVTSERFNDTVSKIKDKVGRLRSFMMIGDRLNNAVMRCDCDRLSNEHLREFRDQYYSRVLSMAEVSLIVSFLLSVAKLVHMAIN